MTDKWNSNPEATPAGSRPPGTARPSTALERDLESTRTRAEAQSATRSASADAPAYHAERSYADRARGDNTDNSEDDKSSAELEREVEFERAQITGTLEELRSRMSPGQIVDQALDYARESGGGDFARNLGRSVRDNPLPVLLIGAGIGWLMSTGGRPHERPGGYRGSRKDARRLAEGMSSADPHHEDSSGFGSTVAGAMGRVTDSASSMASSAREGISRATGAASNMMSSARDGVSRASGAASDMSASAYESTTGRAGAAAGRFRDSAGAASQRAGEFAHDARDEVQRMGHYAQRGWTRLAEDQPLILGAIGLAIGAAIGAALPSTRTEDRFMGSTSDALKGQVKDTATEQFEHAKEVASETYRDVVDDLDKRGFSPDAAAGALSSAAEKVGSAANKVAEDAKSEIKPDASQKSTGTGSTTGGASGSAAHSSGSSGSSGAGSVSGSASGTAGGSAAKTGQQAKNEQGGSSSSSTGSPNRQS